MKSSNVTKHRTPAVIDQEVLRIVIPYVGPELTQAALSQAAVYADLDVEVTLIDIQVVPYKPVSAGQMLSRNLLIYGLGGIIVPFPGIWAIDKLIVALGLV